MYLEHKMKESQVTCLERTPQLKNQTLHSLYCYRLKYHKRYCWSYFQNGNNISCKSSKQNKVQHSFILYFVAVLEILGYIELYKEYFTCKNGIRF